MSSSFIEHVLASKVTLGLFFMSAYWFTAGKRRRKLLRQQSLQYGFPVSYDDEDEDEDTIPAMVKEGFLGTRGSGALKQATPHWDGFFQCLQNPCDPVNNPHGHIALCVAENKLVQEALAKRLMQPGTAYMAFSDSIAYCYNGFLGLPATREAVAYFLTHRFLNPTKTRGTSQMHVSPDCIALGSGCASLLNHLFFSLAEKGDAVLIPAPYHSAFEYDMQAVAGCVPIPVRMQNPIHGPSPDELLMAAYAAEKLGLNVKILLLNNPNDPLGVVYSPTVMRNAIEWARSRDMHVVVDEIYALSVHQKDNNGFESVIELLENELGKNVHMIWGLSKDFGASGFRIGMLYTQNEWLLQALANLNIFSGVSHPMQLILADILTDDAFCDAFFEDARAQLKWSYTTCAQKLDEMVIPFVAAEAGLCVYVDFSSLLPSQTFEGEEEFASLVQEYARVVMTPGQGMRDQKPGMFRICHAWVSSDVLEIAMERLSYLITKIRRYEWEDLDANSLNDVLSCGSRNIRRNASIDLASLTGMYNT